MQQVKIMWDVNLTIKYSSNQDDNCPECRDPFIGRAFGFEKHLRDLLRA